jgi:hypothetical protein
VNWALDADIRGFFDNMSHGWILKFIEHRVADRRLLRLIQKWLKAGVAEEGQWSETKLGKAQERKGLWFSHSTTLPVSSGDPPELDQSRLIRM